MSGRLTALLVAMATLLVTGLSTGTRIYYLFFWILTGILVTSFISVLWTLLTVRVGARGISQRATRGEAQLMILSVRHGSLLPVGEVCLQLRVPGAGGATQEVRIPMPGRREQAFRHTLDCPHRGVYETGVERIVVRDLFRLLHLSRRSGLKLVRMEILPKAADCAPMALRAADMGPEYIARSSEDTASPSDVRSWQEGDSLKKVHWKLSMRRREILVRTYEESARPDTLIIPDLSHVTALKDQQMTLEDCICERCLGAAKAQLEAGYPVRMPLMGAGPTELSGQLPADAPMMADALMRIQFDSSFEYDNVLIQMMPRMQRTGGAIFVTARLTARTADLTLRMQHSGVQTKLIWITDDPREESLEMLEQLRMQNVLVEQVDPWNSDGRRMPPVYSGDDCF